MEPAQSGHGGPLLVLIGPTFFHPFTPPLELALLFDHHSSNTFQLCYFLSTTLDMIGAGDFTAKDSWVWDLKDRCHHQVMQGGLSVFHSLGQPQPLQ